MRREGGKQRGRTCKLGKGSRERSKAGLVGMSLRMRCSVGRGTLAREVLSEGDSHAASTAGGCHRSGRWRR